VLNGEKRVAGDSDTAGTIIVTARIAGDQREVKRVGVFLVPANAKGVDIRGYETLACSHAADARGIWG
jgi:alkylation response protein AidB-like acyl-CoA dehydrogenase